VYVELKLASQTPEDLAASLSELTTKGLRAQLRTANILTGQLYITLADFPNLTPVETPQVSLPFMMPTVPSDDLGAMQAQIASIIEKLTEFPLRKLQGI